MLLVVQQKWVEDDNLVDQVCSGVVPLSLMVVFVDDSRSPKQCVHA